VAGGVGPGGCCVQPGRAVPGRDGQRQLPAAGHGGEGLPAAGAGQEVKAWDAHAGWVAAADACTGAGLHAPLLPCSALQSARWPS